jgi:hypothetical protein
VQAGVDALELGRAAGHQVFQVLPVAHQLLLGGHAVADVGAGAHDQGLLALLDAARDEQVGRAPAVAGFQHGLDHRLALLEHLAQALGDQGRSSGTKKSVALRPAISCGA